MVLGIVKGEPLVTKAAKAAIYGVFPAAMIAALIYTPPTSTRKPESKSGSSSSSN